MSALRRLHSSAAATTNSTATDQAVEACQTFAVDCSVRVSP
ncbi:hypothetical protein [Streptosporangium sp. NPDC001681]